MLGLCLGCGDRQPGSLESAFVGRLKRNVTIRGKRAMNPLPATAENVAAGRTYFSAYCVVCHGLDGQNTGVPFASRMSPPVPELNSPAVQAYSDGQLKWIIENGIFPSGMPGSRGMLRDEEMWAIVHYIRHLPRKGSLGEPAAYGGSTVQ
jgi:mono/diheme cytochrome c family protein